MRDGKFPEEWRKGLIVPVWKRKGDAHDPGKYRGIMLLNHVLKDSRWKDKEDSGVKREKNNKVSEEEEVWRMGCSF